MKRSDYDRLIDGVSQTQRKKINAQLRAYFTDEVNYRLHELIAPYSLFDYAFGTKIEMENGPEGNVEVHLRDSNACHGFGAPYIPERDFTFAKAELFEPELQPSAAR